MNINLPEKVKIILDTIHAAGYEAYAVGGCVRDSLMRRKPHDWDIATSARPEQVKALFDHTIDTGLKHGTVTAMLGKEGFEITTYRIDGKYEDGRHPNNVEFTASLQEDLRRRDFTVNAMAYNETEGLIDIFAGKEDLKNGVIRAVGDPKERFSEDALRMLRAIRFSAQFGFDIEEKTKDAIRELAPTLEKISAERIQAEMIKLLVSPHPEYLRTAYDTGVTKVFFPEWDRAMETPQNHPHHCYGVGEHILRSLTEVPADRVLRLTMLFHDIAKPETITTDENGITHFHGHAAASERMSREIMQRLRMDNDTIAKVCKLVLYHDYGNGMATDARTVRHAVNKIGEDLFPAYLRVRRADVLAQSDYKREEKLSELAAWQQHYREIMEKGESVSLKTLAVTGNDLIAIGIKPGKEIGEILNRLLQEVMDEPSLNSRERLLERAKALIAAK